MIKSSAIAVLENIPEIEGITLVSGRADNVGIVVSEIRENPENLIPNIDVDCVVLPELGYISNMGNYPDPETITKTLLDRFKGNLWWIHNYHIGKNPFFTEAVLQIAENSPQQQMVFHIHDFPESGRYANFTSIHRYVTMPLYPVSSNVKYVTINSRDRNYLTKAGIPEDSVFLLDNPVEPIKREKGERRLETERNAIDKVLSNSAPSYIKGAPLLIYPVRTIRRKNVLEAGLLARCSRTPVNLLVTLPGISETEKGYSNLVDSCFDLGLIPGAAQAGIKAAKGDISFIDLIDAGSLIISSSVQEGFGYLYINSLQWGKPLFTRNLEIIDGFRDIYKEDWSYFYDEIKIPLENSLREILREHYHRKIMEVGIFLDKEIVSTLSQQIKLMLQMDTIDFSYLSPSMQKKFLKNLSDPGLLRDTQTLNSISLEQMEKLLSTNLLLFNSKIIKRFNLSNHANQIQRIISSFENKPQGTMKSINIQDNVLSYFAGLPSIRLLFNTV